jgi:hypothetical protein
MSFFQDNAAVLGWLFIVSLVMFFGTLLLLPVVVAMLPADYFVRRREDRWPKTLLGSMGLILKNVLGLVFVVMGIVMLFSPGQGVLTILVGIMLLNFPGKRRLEFWLVRKPTVAKALNWIRRKAKRPPLVLTQEHPQAEKPA